jgi:nucleoredoxin
MDCPACTFKNEAGAAACAVCEAPMAAPAAAASAAAAGGGGAAPAASPAPSDKEARRALMLRAAEARAAGIAPPATATQAYAAGAPPPTSASPGLRELLGASLVNRAGKTVSTAEALAGKDFVFVYCSAHWCPPCRAFTPALTAWMNKNGSGKKVGFVFASSDRDEQAFKGYFAEMAADGLALPFGDERIEAIGRKFEVKGIPTLLLFSIDGKLVTNDGRGGVAGDVSAARFPWRK